MVDGLRLNLARVPLILRQHILVNDLALMKILGLDYAAHHQLLRLLARLLLNQLLDLHRLLLRLKRFLIGRLLADVLSIYHLFDIELLYLLVFLQDKLPLVVRGCDIHKQFSQQLHQRIFVEDLDSVTTELNQVDPEHIKRDGLNIVNLEIIDDRCDILLACHQLKRFKYLV